MKVVDIAQEIYFDLSSPTDLSVAAIAFWVRANIGQLNSFLMSDFFITDSYEVVDSSNNTEININAVAVLKKLYMVYRYAILIRSKISAAGIDEIVEIQDQDTKVRKLDKNQLIKTFAELKKQEQQELKELINAYRSKSSTPLQLVGDDTIQGVFPNGYTRVSRVYGYNSY